MTSRAPVVVLLLTFAIAGCQSKANLADRIKAPDWPDFSSKVKDYTDLVDRLERELPPLGDRSNAGQIAAHKAALAKAVRQARSGAGEGAIFTPSVRQKFLRVVRDELKGEPARSLAMEDNPKHEGSTPVTLAVNAPYPDAAPLSTVPPSLLLRLPVLPENIEYRFVGRALVLRDARADLIVDYIPNAAA